MRNVICVLQHVFNVVCYDMCNVKQREVMSFRRDAYTLKHAAHALARSDAVAREVGP